MEQLKVYPTVGVCGLDCGLCPRYYTVGASKCPGCGGPGFLEKHPSCSFITCCVKKRGLEVCGECQEFPCPKFKSEEEYRQLAESSSYAPYRNILPNLRCIKEKGIKAFVTRQEKRIALLDEMLEGYDDGRSKSFFCRAAALLDPKILRESLAKAKAAMSGSGAAAPSSKDKATVLRTILREAAVTEAVELTAKK